MGGGAAVLVFSFLDLTEGGGKAWDTFVFIVLVIFGLAMAGQVALSRFAGVNTGSGVAGWSWSTIHLILGFYCAVFTVSYLIDTGGWDIGFYGMLVGSIALLVGAVMLQKQPAGTAGPGPSV